MAKLLKLRRGTTTQHASFTGAEGEVTIDTTKDTAVVHDGSQAGGRPLLREDLNNITSANLAAKLADDSLATSKLAGGALPTDVTVTNANVVSNAAIAGTKVSPDFGSQGITTTGTASIGNGLTLTGTNPYIDIVDSNNNDDFTIKNDNGNFKIQDKTDTTDRLTIASDGTTTFASNVDFSSGIDVTGAITATGDITVTNASPTVNLVDSGDNPDYYIRNHDGTLKFHDSTNSANRLVIHTDGHLEIGGNTDFGAGIDVTGNISVSGTVDGRDVAADGTKLDGIESGATADQTDAEIATALRGEAIGSSSDGVHDVYTDNWFRNNDSDEGLYNQSTGQHWYSDNANYWNMGGSSTSQGIKFRDTHGQTIRAYIYYTTGNEIGFLNNSGSWSLKCDSSGNVTATGNVTAYSDARLKTNVNTINDALSIVGKLRGVSFDWKESGKHSVGVIAQEVEKVLPEVVLTQETSDEANKEKREIKSVDYGKIVGVLINAINELKAEVDELKGGN